MHKDVGGCAGTEEKLSQIPSLHSKRQHHEDLKLERLNQMPFAWAKGLRGNSLCFKTFNLIMMDYRAKKLLLKK